MGTTGPAPRFLALGDVDCPRAGPMNGSDAQEIETARRVLRDLEARAERQMEIATAMEWVGDRHGASIAHERLRIERAAIKLALDRLRALETSD